MFITTEGGGGPTTASAPDQSLSRLLHAPKDEGWREDTALEDDDRRKRGEEQQVKIGDPVWSRGTRCTNRGRGIKI